MSRPSSEPPDRHGHLPEGRRGLFSRRQFLGAAGLASALTWQSPLRAAEPKQTNPFAYDLSRHTKTDPKLIQYAELKRFRCPRAHARRITVGPDQRLYVAAGKYVSIFDREGEPVGDRALSAEARATAVAEDGTLYVSVRDHIEVFAPNQDRATAWESPGKRTWITGLAVTKNDVFAADSGNRVVLRLDRSGKAVGRIGERDKDRNVPGLVLPSPFLDVDVHPDGLLRVNNTGRHLVETYTFDGHMEGAWGKATAAIDGFCGCCNPIGLAILADGRIVTSEKGLPRVKVYSKEGQFECVVAGVESFPENNALQVSDNEDSQGVIPGLDVAADAQGRVYVLDLVTSHVRIFARKPNPAS